MIQFRLLYPGFKKKSVTFSYDDGVIQDKTLIEIFNHYGMKATFNLNAGKVGEKKFRTSLNGDEIDCSHLLLSENVSLYDGHEIANHTYSHPHLEDITIEEQEKEYRRGKEELEAIFNKKVFGAAYPYGSYNYDTFEVQKRLKIEYDRTTRSTYSFKLPTDWLCWHPTIHHREKQLNDVVNSFYKTDEELALLYIWGHSYEFAIDDNFSLMDNLCRNLITHEDIAFMTNHEIYTYCNAATRVYHRVSSIGQPLFYNPSDVDVYIEVDGLKLVIPKRGVYPYEQR